MPSTASYPWTVATAWRGEEQRAAHHCEKRGFEVYQPVAMHPDASGEFRLRRQLFPGYIFVKMREGWEHILHLPGIHKFMLVDEKPVPVPEHEITRWRALEDDTGCVRIGGVHRFQSGDLVSINEHGGIYAGLVCRVKKVVPKRCEVQLRIMGRQVRKWFDERTLEPAPDPAAAL